MPSSRARARICLIPTFRYVVHTDASGFAVGAVLQQDQGKGLQPIAFLSKKMLRCRDALPGARAGVARHHPRAERWRHYLHGAKFTVMTDHQSLQYFKTQPQLSGRQSRWKDVIANFDFDIEYIEGKTNVVADGLSRRAIISLSIARSCCNLHTRRRRRNRVNHSPLSLDRASVR